jgi:hypothetical protein
MTAPLTLLDTFGNHRGSASFRSLDIVNPPSDAAPASRAAAAPDGHAAGRPTLPPARNAFSAADRKPSPRRRNPGRYREGMYWIFPYSRLLGEVN